MSSPGQEIVFNNVSKFYGEVLGVNRVSLVIPRGITSLVGPNGSGKTTLMNLCTGLLQPTEGRIRLLGLAPTEPEELFRNRPAESNMGDVLVVGGGISGIQASLDLADTGFRVYLVDKSPAIGVKMSQLDKTFPTNDCSMCIESPKFIECSRNPNV